MACAGGPKNGIVNLMEVVLRPLMALCWNRQCEHHGRIYVANVRNKWFTYDRELSRYLYIRSLYIIPHGGGGSSRFRVALSKGHRYSGIHANRLFPELPSAHCALAEKSKKVRAIPRCPMPRPPRPPYLVCCKFCLHKWNAPFRISTSSDRSVECYFRMEFSNYSPSPRASCDVAADSLYSEKYHFKKIPLEVAKGTISPNLATVRPYHSNKHFVAREGTKKRGKTQIAFQYFFLYFVTSKNCYKDKEFLNAAKLATSRSCRYFRNIKNIFTQACFIDITSRRKYADFNNRYVCFTENFYLFYVHVKYRSHLKNEEIRKARHYLETDEPSLETALPDREERTGSPVLHELFAGNAE
ncbi:hypothetical protein ALC60_06146 [Trachymyrmex zeteki]|uniref:Uncharacterized protein n=1 Tax=Mycetomoellerius zeteki TaxID=64791 RepID=A0A151X3J3_9HYME|nr:hypothetical protein ALC60_06146 [Trachymyrmex zeteki]